MFFIVLSSYIFSYNIFSHGTFSYDILSHDTFSDDIFLVYFLIISSLSCMSTLTSLQERILKSHFLNQLGTSLRKSRY